MDETVRTWLLHTCMTLMYVEVFLCLTSLSLSADKAQLKAMLDAVCDLMRGGRLSTPHCIQTSFDQYTHALQATVHSHGRKHVLIM